MGEKIVRHICFAHYQSYIRKKVFEVFMFAYIEKAAQKNHHFFNFSIHFLFFLVFKLIDMVF